ncbi:hypothetical protein C8F01DRAFT_1138437 [Mycena amicta]|nr:hypothetical protein C8F01DRAFT_1138437 [Mycena amicta]
MKVESDTENLVRCEDLWFSDCGLVIRAEKTVFRVSRDVMAFHSPIFRDMLALPTPASAESFEGCPLVSLPDTAEDVTYFLKALIHYDFFSPQVDQNPFDVLAAILRMTHKYEVAPLRKHALAQLSTLFPTTLPLAQSTHSVLQSTQEPLLEMTQVIILARQLRLDWILPLAFYELCRTGEERGVLDSELTTDDKYLWVIGCRTLGTNEMRRMLDYLWNPLVIEGCQSKSDSGCLRMRFLMRRIIEGVREFSAQGIPRFPLDDVFNLDAFTEGKVCSTCHEYMKGAYATAVQAFWDRLPGLFDLPAWDELERRKTEVLAS